MFVWCRAALKCICEGGTLSTGGAYATGMYATEYRQRDLCLLWLTACVAHQIQSRILARTNRAYSDCRDVGYAPKSAVRDHRSLSMVYQLSGTVQQGGQNALQPCAYKWVVWQGSSGGGARAEKQSKFLIPPHHRQLGWVL